jgi:hypothetical protein
MAPMILDGPMTGGGLFGYVQQLLAPTLSAKSGCGYGQPAGPQDRKCAKPSRGPGQGCVAPAIFA